MLSLLSKPPQATNSLVLQPSMVLNLQAVELEGVEVAVQLVGCMLAINPP
jgi:hypothetical protein